MGKVVSVNRVPIRLTEERWFHITEGHPEMAGYYFEVLEAIGGPDGVYKGDQEELFALREIEKGKYIVVVYKEVSEEDGFVITSFMTRKERTITRREEIWPSQKT